MIAQQAIRFFLDHRIALAREHFEVGAIEHRNLPAMVLNYAELLQLAGRVGDTFIINWLEDTRSSDKSSQRHSC